MVYLTKGEQMKLRVKAHVERGKEGGGGLWVWWMTKTRFKWSIPLWVLHVPSFDRDPFEYLLRVYK